MCSLTLEIEDGHLESYESTANELGMSVAEWALKLMEDAHEDHELAKLADEAYREYLADPETYTLEEVIRRNGDGDLLGDA